MLPTSEYDTTPECEGCDRLLSIEFDNGTEVKQLCGWYGEPDFACDRRIDLGTESDFRTYIARLKRATRLRSKLTRSCLTCHYEDNGNCLRAAPYFTVATTDLCGGYEVR